MASSKDEFKVSVLSYGDGAHKLNIAAPEELNAVLENAGHTFGKGADAVSIEIKAVKADGTALVQAGLKNAYIDLGEGNNSLTVSVAGGSGTPPANSKGLDGGSGTPGEGALLIAGKGNDRLTLSGMDTALDHATVLLGAGANSVSVSATTAMTDSVLVTEGGNDVVSMSGAVTNSTLNLGDGANTLTLIGAVSGSAITGGSGADKVSVSGDVSGASTLSLGAGNNALTLNGKLEGNSQVVAGAGADGRGRGCGRRGGRPPACSWRRPPAPGRRGPSSARWAIRTA
jgi:hypothetical protein